MSAIVVGVEDSDEGREAMRFAASLARQKGDRLHVVSVHSDMYFYDGVDAMEAARANYFEGTQALAREELSGEFEFHRLMELSVPAGLTRVAEEVDAESMVIGSSHRGPFGRVLMGDHGSRLASGSPCTVIVVPRGWVGSEADIGGIGVAYDGTGESAAALSFGQDLAGRVGASICLIGVVPKVIDAGRIAHTDRGYQSLLISDMEKTIDEAASGLGMDEVSTRVMVGNPADELARASEDLDFMVVGSRSYGPVRRVLLGGTSFRITRSAACPVGIVPKTAG